MCPSKTILRTLLAALSFPAAVGGAVAGDLASVAQVDLRSGWRSGDGAHMAALHVRLSPGWKTYWRAPGDAGIPPRFDWEGSRNIRAVRLHWPVPEVFWQNGMRSIGYADELVLPIEITPARPGEDIHVEASVEFGVCEDVCIPVTARLSGALDASDGQADGVIGAALADQAIGADAAGLRTITCRVEPIADGIRLNARIDLPPIGTDEVAVVELSDQTVWVSEASVVRSGDSLLATTDMVPPDGAPFLIDRSDIRITLIADGRAVDIRGCPGE